MKAGKKNRPDQGGKEATQKPKGWHSRRHETSAANDEARAAYGTPRDRQLSALHQREAELIDYQSDRWWKLQETVVPDYEAEMRFPEYPHLTEKEQEQFRMTKAERAMRDIANLRTKLHIKEGS